MATNVSHIKLKQSNGTGSKLTNRFIKSFENEFCRKLEKYAKYRKEENDLEHIFYYGEQPTKTYVTAVLDKICDTNFMQECFVQRKYISKRKREVTHNGRVDYWCRYGAKTKFCALLEFKQSWIRYYCQNKWTIYSSTIKNHKSGVRQIKSIKNKTQFTSDYLYAFAITLIPIFIQYKKPSEKPIWIDSSKLKQIAKDVCKKTEAHGFGTFIIPRNLCKVETFEDSQGAKNYQSFPAIIFLWSEKKIHKG